MKNPIFFVLMSFGLSISSAAFAADAEKREDRQRHRIYQGVANDAITEREFGRLEEQQERINDYRQKAQKGGLTQKEERRLKKMQKNAHEAIKQLKGNNNEHADVNIRQKAQSERIYDGVENGRLTKKEYRKTQQRQNAIERFEAQAAADGISEQEQKRLDTMQDRASRQIYQLKHNKAGKRGKSKAKAGK